MCTIAANTGTIPATSATPHTATTAAPFVPSDFIRATVWRATGTIRLLNRRYKSDHHLCTGTWCLFFPLFLSHLFFFYFFILFLRLQA